MRRLDPDQSGTIEREEFVDAMLSYVAISSSGVCAEMSDVTIAQVRSEGEGQEEEGEAEGEEDDVEVPEEWQSLSAAEQQSLIKRKAAKMMAVGTLLIVLFSDPAVDVMSNVGSRIGLAPFYVAFVLAPLASNASEFIASYSYAAKKTKKTISVSLAALEGAACMNNTFCLAIFMGLVLVKGLAWKFAAETLSILVVQVLVALVAVQRTQRLWMGVLLLLLFPLSVAFVAALEAAGLD